MQFLLTIAMSLSKNSRDRENGGKRDSSCPILTVHFIEHQSFHIFDTKKISRKIREHPKLHKNNAFAPKEHLLVL